MQAQLIKSSCKAGCICFLISSNTFAIAIKYSYTAIINFFFNSKNCSVVKRNKFFSLISLGFIGALLFAARESQPVKE